MDVLAEVAKTIEVPENVANAASLLSDDLYHGPLYGIRADGVTPVYWGDQEDDDLPFDRESLTQLVRSFIEDSIGTKYYEEWSGCVSDTEPTGEYVENPDYCRFEAEEAELREEEYLEEETIWQDPEPYYECNCWDIATELFGRVVREVIQ